MTDPTWWHVLAAYIAGIGSAFLIPAAFAWTERRYTDVREFTGDQM